MEREYYENLLKDCEACLITWLKSGSEYMDLALAEILMIQEIEDKLKNMKKEVA